MLHAATLFTSAALLFLVQPLWARMTLPVAGGSAAVWALSMLAFQLLLLAGYGLAHLVARGLSPRVGAAVHVGLVAVAALQLPITFPVDLVPRAGADPSALLTIATLRSVALPFLALSTLSPAVQRWYALSGGQESRNPYRLYAASNAGSLLGLLAGPLVEPIVGVRVQAVTWQWGYLLLVPLLVACAWPLWRPVGPLHGDPPPQDADPATDSTTTETPSGAKPTASLRLAWLVLAALPSCLSIAVTAHLCNAVATLPLLWVLPLAVYLLTFVIAFGRNPPPEEGVRRVAAILVAAVVFLLATRANHPAGLLVALHLAAVGAVCLVCHLRLQRLRPPPAQLTGFYLWLALGGALGGVFNAIAAPQLFTSIAEYPLALAGAVAVGWGHRTLRSLRTEVIAALPAVGIALALGLAVAGAVWWPDAPPLVVTAACGAAALACWLRARSGLGFAFAVAGVLLGAHVAAPAFEGHATHAVRSFYGVHRVTEEPHAGLRQLFHGVTVHGRQALAPGQTCEPLLYYHRTGPIGDVFAASADVAAARDHVGEFGAAASAVGVVGLGTGCLACYARPGQAWTFFEIDPDVERLARGAGFTFLARTPGHVTTVIGDARVTLRQVPVGSFGLLVLDAYSSDTIPVHLLTREAMALYASRLAPGGVMALHISNRYFDLGPVVARLADSVGMLAWVRDEATIGEDERRAGKVESRWMVLARREADLGGLTGAPTWQRLVALEWTPLWTDDLASPLAALADGP